VYKEIKMVAENNKIDLIVMATHGMSELEHFLIGSNSERVVRTASCPVLTVRQNS
jgi:nucleotide-binding universal stress UspA family protein